MDTSKIISLLNSFSDIFNDEIKLLSSLENLNKDSRFRIANAGPMNSGKSTLFNALLQKEETFKTADARQTIKCQEEPWDKNFTLVDTPGFNANGKDDNEATEAFKSVDYILFVHNINTGGLNRAELKYLKYLQNIFGNNEFIKRVTIVCNKLDEADDDVISRNEAEIVSQLQENMQLKLQVLCVAPKIYLQAMMTKDKKDKNILIEYSKMSPLIKHIQSNYQALGKRKYIDLEPIVAKLQSLKNDKETFSQKLYETINTKKSNASRDWQIALNNIEPAWVNAKNKKY